MIFMAGFTSLGLLHEPASSHFVSWLSAGLQTGPLLLVVQADQISEVTHEPPSDGPGYTSWPGQTMGNIPNISPSLIWIYPC
jgi:hypothetical protein